MRRRTTMLMSALFVAGAFAINGNTAKADTVVKQPADKIQDDSNAIQESSAKDKAELRKVQEDLTNKQADKIKAEDSKKELTATLEQKQATAEQAKKALDKAKGNLEIAQDVQNKYATKYDSSFENNVKSAQVDKDNADKNEKDLEDQVQDSKNKQNDLIDQKNTADSEIKANTETLNKANEDLAKVQENQIQAQKNFGNVQKHYAQIQEEYEAKKSATNKATQDLEQNKSDLAKSQKALSDLQTNNNDLDKAVNSIQNNLSTANIELTNTQSNLSGIQTKANDIQKKINNVNIKLTEAVDKRDGAKTKLDSYNQSSFVVPENYKNTFIKWLGIDGVDGLVIKDGGVKFNYKQYENEMRLVSSEGEKLNNFKHNTQDEKRMVNVNHMTENEKLELNKFSTRLINQIRVQMGKKPVNLNRSAMAFADEIAKNYIKDRFMMDDPKYDRYRGHDTPAISLAAQQYGLDPTKNYYEDMADSFVVPKNAKNADAVSMSMDKLKEGIYNAIKLMIFSQKEWNHAQGLLTMGYMSDYDKWGTHKNRPIYAGMSMSIQPDKYDDGTGQDTYEILFHFIDVPGDIQTKDGELSLLPRYIGDKSKFDTEDNISLDRADNSKVQQAYNQAADEVNNLTAQKNNLNNQIQNINDQIKNNQHIINDLTVKISNLSNELAKAKQQKHEVEDSINTISKHISDLKSSQPVLIQAQNKATNDLNAYQQKHADAIKDYSKAKIQLDKLDDDLKLANNNKIGATQNLKQAQDKLGQINKELDIVNTQLTDLEAKVSSAKNSQIVANENLLRAQTAFNNYLAAYQDADNKLKKAKIDLATKAEEFKKAKSNYDTANTDYQTTNNQIIELDRQISNLKNDINEAQAKVTKLSEIIKTKENSQNKNNKVNKIETVVNGKSNVLIISKHDDIKERPISNLKNNSSENEDTKLSDIVKINKQNNYSENNKVEVTVNRSSSTPILSKYNSMKGNQAKLSTITNENNKFNNQVINSKNNSQVSNFSKHDQTSNEKGVTTNKVKLPQTSEKQGFFASLLGMFLATLGLGIFGADRSRDRKE